MFHSLVRRRLSLVSLAAVLLALGGTLGATGASAADMGTTAFMPSGAATVSHKQVPLTPSYYVTARGQRLSAAQAKASPADSLPVYFVEPGVTALVPGIHACEETGTHGGVSGVECADLLVSRGTNATSTVEISPAGEGYCQGPDGLTQCAAIKFIMEVANAPAPGKSDTLLADAIECGHTFHACSPTGRNNFLGTDTHFGKAYNSGCNESAGGGFEFWTVVLPSTIIALPGDVNSSAPGNLSSQHVIICPGTN